MSNEHDQVRVHIEGTVTLRLSETVWMPRAKFERLNALYESEDGLGVDDAEQFLDCLDLLEPASVDYDDVDAFELDEQ